MDPAAHPDTTLAAEYMRRILSIQRSHDHAVTDRSAFHRGLKDTLADGDDTADTVLAAHNLARALAGSTDTAARIIGTTLMSACLAWLAETTGNHPRREESA